MNSKVHTKPFLFLVALFVSHSLFAQPVATKGFQANINSKPGNTVAFRVRPIATTTTSFSLFNFCVRVPAAASFTWGTITPNTTDFPLLSISRSELPQAGGFRVFLFEFTNPAGTTSRTYNANTSYEVFTVTTSVDPTTLGLQLAHEGTETNWFYAIADVSAVNLMPSDNSNTLVFGSYFYPSTSNVGSDFLSALTTLLPANLGDFSVQKQGDKGASLVWTTLQEQNVSHFTIERSLSQNAGWTALGEVKAKGESSLPTKYSFTDLDAYDGFSASKTVFYRIRAVDLDGKQTIFPIRSLRFANNNKGITIYPNPVKDGFTISVPVQNPADKKIRMNLINQAGQLLHAREISASQAANYYYDIKTPGVITGEYLLQIHLDGQLLETKKILVQR